MKDIFVYDFEPVSVALLPVGGYGMCFLPATNKEYTKELMPLIDRPLIHYSMIEAVNSGCSKVVFVTGNGKESIVNYFIHSKELDETLRSKGIKELLEEVRRIPDLEEFH